MSHGGFWQHQSIWQHGWWQRPKGAGSQGPSPEQPEKALTCCFMAGVASTLVASGKGITRSKMLDHDWAHMLPGKHRRTMHGRRDTGREEQRHLVTPDSCTEWITLPGPCPACTRVVQAGACPCRRGQVMLSVLPFPEADWLLQTHLMGPWSFSQS